MRWLLLGVALSGCHNMSPPPLVMRHAGAHADLVGDTRIQLIFGVNAGILSVDTGVGVALQLSHQVDETVKAGGNLGVGFNVDHFDTNPQDHPMWLLAGRGFSRFHVKDGGVAGEAGLGLGYTGNETLYITGDLGGQFGFQSSFLGNQDGELFVYWAPTFAVSVPIIKGRPTKFPKVRLMGAPRVSDGIPTLRYPKTTWAVSVSMGSLGQSKARPSYGGSLEVYGMVAWDEKEGSFNMGVSSGPSMVVGD